MILTHEQAKALRLSSIDTLEVIRNTEAAVIAKLAKGVEMPEPVGYLDGQGDSYTADQLRTVAAAARLKALEDAANVAVNGLGLTTVSVASRIRALKGAA